MTPNRWLVGFQGGMLLLSMISTLFKGLIAVIVIIIGVKIVLKALKKGVTSNGKENTL